jgi:hypothetical protein
MPRTPRKKWSRDREIGRKPMEEVARESLERLGVTGAAPVDPERLAEMAGGAEEAALGVLSGEKAVMEPP